jgi:ABC-type glutathione transport system ATPase component
LDPVAGRSFRHAGSDIFHRFDTAESRGQNAVWHVSQINGLRKVYRNQEVIRNVSLSVAANKFVSICGPSGCGKARC